MARPGVRASACARWRSEPRWRSRRRGRLLPTTAVARRSGASTGHRPTAPRAGREGPGFCRHPRLSMPSSPKMPPRDRWWCRRRPEERPGDERPRDPATGTRTGNGPPAQPKDRGPEGRRRVGLEHRPSEGGGRQWFAMPRQVRSSIIAATAVATLSALLLAGCTSPASPRRGPERSWSTRSVPDIGLVLVNTEGFDPV